MTKLRFVLGDSDEKFLKRFSDYVTFHYGDKLEIYIFTEMELLGEFIQENRVNGVFAGKDFLDIRQKIKRDTVFAYLSAGIETEQKEGVVTFIKYQSADALVKEMMSLCSEQVVEVRQRRNGENGKIILFESPAGGVGTTLAAVACACNFSRHGKKTLYLNLERFGSLDGILKGDGKSDFSDVLYALKSKRTNLFLKLESIVRQDISGIFFIEPCSQPMDLGSLTKDEADHLFDTLLGEGGYDAVILDRNSGLEEFDTMFRKMADEIILVADADGKQTEKLKKFFAAISYMEEKVQEELCSKMKLLYNRYHGKDICHEFEKSIRSLGRLPRLDGLPENHIIERFAAETFFEKLL